ncbi:hypothetical protein ACV07N_08285 [Roseivirga echinicomitans]
MAKALDKILTKEIPHHLRNTDLWGVPAYWIEKQLKPEESLEKILEKFYVWIKFGFTEEEGRSLIKFSMDNPNLDTSQILWGIWSYLDSVLSKMDYKELLTENIFKKDYSDVSGNRKEIL